MQLLDTATGKDLVSVFNKAVNLVNFAFMREIGAIESIKEIYTNSENAKIEVNNRIQQLKLFSESIQNHLEE